MNGALVFRASEQESPEPVLPVAAIPLKGEHNVENVLAAICAAEVAKLPRETIARSVRSFRAVEHRLEFVARIEGVDYYNDSKATNVDAAAKAIASFPANIHLILGGKDKNSDYTELLPLIHDRVKAVYTIGSAAEKIERQLGHTTTLWHVGTLDAAIEKAAQAAVSGDVVLLAPACSSFDQFENYEHRGRLFKELVARRGGKLWQSA
jgi:UDP-N-acetylmuramoylalanine--D-glutamate ligase